MAKGNQAHPGNSAKGLCNHLLLFLKGQLMDSHWSAEAGFNSGQEETVFHFPETAGIQGSSSW